MPFWTTETRGKFIAYLSRWMMEATILPQNEAKDHSVRADGVFGHHREHTEESYSGSQFWIVPLLSVVEK